MKKKIIDFIFSYFGENFLRQSFSIILGFLIYISLDKISSYLDYKNKSLLKFNNDIANNNIVILSKKQIEF